VLSFIHKSKLKISYVFRFSLFERFTKKLGKPSDVIGIGIVDRRAESSTEEDQQGDLGGHSEDRDAQFLNIASLFRGMVIPWYGQCAGRAVAGELRLADVPWIYIGET